MTTTVGNSQNLNKFRFSRNSIQFGKLGKKLFRPRASNLLMTCKSRAAARLPPRRCQITSETLRELGSTYFIVVGPTWRVGS